MASRARRAPRQGRKPPGQETRLPPSAAGSCSSTTFMFVWTFLDLTPLGRQENWEDLPAGYPQTSLTSGGAATTSTRTSRCLLGGTSDWNRAVPEPPQLQALCKHQAS